jgi:hypothetical protein
MRKAAVRDGDATTTGGFVSVSSSKLIRDGRKKVALSGDEATPTGYSEPGQDYLKRDATSLLMTIWCSVRVERIR